MKLTGDLKNQVEKAESKDEKKSLIENAGMELTDDELKNVCGGSEIHYGMEDDPLCRRFTSFWNNTGNIDEAGSVTDSRTEFMNAFSQWVKDGVPENISGWYSKYNQSV